MFFWDIIHDITYLELFLNPLFFTSWQKNPFPVFSVDSSVVRMAESAEVIGLVEAEDLKPNDLVGVNKEPATCHGSL